jgi:colicin import membrane protein
MPSIADRAEFTPPNAPGVLRAMGLAILAHMLLVAALTWGVNWKSQTALSTAQAELWSSIPQEAAPRAPEPVLPTPPPVLRPVDPPPAPPPVTTPDIVEKIDKPPKKPLPKPPEPKPEPPVDTAALKREAQREAQRKAAQESAERDKVRQEAIARATKLAGSGAPDSAGTAAQSSGPSNGYGNRIKARVKPNLVFSSAVTGNPLVSIEIRQAPDGTILGRPRVVKSSGNREWDEAVVRAFEKTEVLPRDTDGRVHSPLLVEWRVND